MTSKTAPIFKTAAIFAGAGALSLTALLLSQPASPAASARSAATSDVMNLSAMLASTHVLAGKHEAYMAVKLTAPEQPHLARPDVDVAIVFDRSGSMEGVKLVHAKLAAQKLIAGLESGDSFSIVTYGSDVEVLLPSTVATEEARQSAFVAISRIYTDGGTNMSGGILAGQRQLQFTSSQTSEFNHVRRIILISDGEANEGIVDSGGLERLASRAAEQHISLSTVGVGLDFDEQTMTRMAISGQGNYYYAEAPAQIAEILSTELSRLGATIATGITLALDTPPGVTIKEALGYDLSSQGSTTFVHIPDMRSGEIRKVVLSLAIDARGAGAMHLANVGVSFLNQATNTTTNLTQNLTAQITQEQRIVDKSRDKFSNRLIERALTGRAIDKATALYEAGDQAAASAVMKQRAIAAAPIARALNDKKFESEMTKTQGAVEESFATRIISPLAAKRVQKISRKRAYLLAH